KKITNSTKCRIKCRTKTLSALCSHARSHTCSWQRQKRVNPSGGGGSLDRLAFPVSIRRSGTVLQEQSDDLRLLLACGAGTAPTAPGFLTGEVRGRGAVAVLPSHFRAAKKQRAHRRSAASSNCPMQRCDTARVGRIRISARLDQHVDSCKLRFGV